MSEDEPGDIDTAPASDAIAPLEHGTYALSPAPLPDMFALDGVRTYVRTPVTTEFAEAMPMNYIL